MKTYKNFDEFSQRMNGLEGKEAAIVRIDEEGKIYVEGIFGRETDYYGKGHLIEGYILNENDDEGSSRHEDAFQKDFEEIKKKLEIEEIEDDAFHSLILVRVPNVEEYEFDQDLENWVSRGTDNTCMSRKEMREYLYLNGFSE